MISPGPGRARVSARGGPDEVDVVPDGARDVLKGEAGVNALSFAGVGTPVTVDTRTGTAGRAGERDEIRGFRVVRGGGGNDRLFGGEAGEALDGGGGNDRVEGPDGADLIAGSGARLLAGRGDDLIDARSRPLGGPPLQTSPVTCGEGADRVAADTDDLLDASCEAAVYRTPEAETENLDLTALFAPRMPVAPVARGADGAPTLEVPCPSQVGTAAAVGRCVGSVDLQRPPTAGARAPPQRLGRGSFDLQGAQRAAVAVTLNDAGRQALATPGAILALHITGELFPTASAGQQNTCPRPANPSRLPCAEFGWQQAS